MKFNFSSLLDKLLVNKKNNLIFYLFCLVYTLVIIYLSNKVTIWDDESCSLITTDNSLFKVIKLSYFFEGQPPVYFVFLALWRKINDGIFFARLLSLVYTLLSAFVLNKLVRSAFKEFYSKWIVILFLLNPYTIWASLEIRLYAQLILLCFTAIYLFYLIYFCNRPKLRIFFVLVGILGVYTQYYFCFLIISLSLIVLFSKGWRTFWNYCLWAMIVAIIFLPNLLFMADQYAMHQNPLVKEIWYVQLGYILYSPLQFLFAPRELHLGKLGYFLFAFAMFVMFVVFLNKLYREFRKYNYADLKTCLKLFVPVPTLLVIFIIIFLTFNLFYLLHYLTIVFPFFFLLFSSFAIFAKRTRIIIFGIFAMYYIFLLVYVYRPPYVKRLDSRSVANYVHCIEHKNEPILFRDKSIFLTFKPYYKGTNPLISLPDKPLDYNFYRTEIKDTTELKLLLENSTSNSDSFLFINWDDSFMRKEYLTNIKLDDYLNHHYFLTVDSCFNGKFEYDFLRVRHLFKKQK